MTRAHGAATFDVRRAVDADRAAMKELIANDVAGTPYAEAPFYFLGVALDGRAAESTGIVAERAGEVVGVVLYGEVAGSIGTGRIHFVGVGASSRLDAVGLHLFEAALDDLASRGTRLVVAEVPDDPVLASRRALLARTGFAEAARVPDYYRDGVALLILVRPTANPAGSSTRGSDSD